ncbi:D-amino acid dehydrogenase [Acinetobacter populi]|uniref:D-amino acid dehydrogenase n=1 Tax=Acinetobacter populi TaxID=1582270 RepID=A0A1Z9Z1L4_9GAMM|nr:D-amino acid dehydrogenase [Acinetobacter populi]MCH4246260.1 D-amino acid dehydrogenase [Acinetobacter populi]OUY08312.1 D-amino acid dehydrogenase [Acinetobacter populi]
MSHILIIGAGITGVTSAYMLAKLGHQVTVLEKHLCPAMETSFANGGQLSACNAEVWNQISTIKKGLKWIAKSDAPLLLNPSFSVHKYSWLYEFVSNIQHYQENTIETVKLALDARYRLFDIAEQENIDFDLEKRGILHIFHDDHDYAVANQVNQLLLKGGLERFAVTPDEMINIEPSLKGEYVGGFYTPDDATGDIFKFTNGLAKACEKYGVNFQFGVEVTDIKLSEKNVELKLVPSEENVHHFQPQHLQADVLLVCGGVSSYQLAHQLGDRVNIYPVKGYSITVHLEAEQFKANAPWVSLLDERAKIVSSRLGENRLRVAGTAEFNGYNRDIRADRISPLLQWTRENFDLDACNAVPWSGLRPMTPNMMPKVEQGKHSRVFYNTGHGHLGWTLSAATAEIISHKIHQAYA